MKICIRGHLQNEENTRTRQRDNHVEVVCILCNTERCSAWYAANKERAKENQRKYNELNADSQKAANKRWVQNNLEKVRQIKADWKKRNPESNKAYKQRKRLKGGSFPLAEWKVRLSEFNGWCPYCGESGNKLSVDHVVPICKGGTNAIENLIPCCRPCNNKKHTKDLEDWINQL